MKPGLLRGSMLDVPRVSPIVPDGRAPKWTTKTPEQIIADIRRYADELAGRVVID